MKITLLRHAEAEHNVKSSRVAGSALDSQLTDLGRKQAKQAAKQFETQFQVVYHSPAVRCRDTANILIDEWDYIPDEVYEDVRLVEMNQGQQVGRIKLLTIINPRTFVNLLIRRMDFSFEDGESFNQVASRMQEVVDEIESLHKGKSVLVVTHGLAMRCLVAKLSGWSVWRLLLTKVKKTGTILLK